MTLAVALIGCDSSIGAQALRVEREVPLKGDLAHPKELSGAAVWRDFVIACSDEGAELNLLRSKDYRLAAKLSLLDDEDDEIDMEGAAADSQYVYVVGSHSMHRKGQGDSKKKNRKRAPQAKPHEKSYSLFRLTLDEQGEIAASECVSLQDILAQDAVLGPYAKIPGKENGIDIEGVAVKNGVLLVGFRGPVLHGNFVPIMCFEFARPEAYVIKVVELAGHGIRDMTAVQDGFLILSGPVGEEAGDYRLHLWSGADVASRATGLDGRLAYLGQVAIDGDAKPEGIAPISEDDRQWRILLLCDGDSTARELKVRKP
jgi:hypothetical protein